MRATQALLAKGFLARSLDELKRRSSIAWNLDAVKGPSQPRDLYDFGQEEAIDGCIIMSDGLIGGSSQSNLDYVPPIASISPSTASSTQVCTSGNMMETSASSLDSKSPTAYARFHGQISTSLPPNRMTVQRTGYAAFRTPDQAPTIFGRSVWDIDPWTYLALRVKSDGRAYYVNLQTDAVEPTDLHQHRLFAKQPGQWETILIRWNDFVRTNHGFVVEPQTELLRQKVRSFGIGLTDRVNGPFELCIERIWATNTVADGHSVTNAEQGQLRSRDGKKMQWQVGQRS